MKKKRATFRRHPKPTPRNRKPMGYAAAKLIANAALNQAPFSLRLARADAGVKAGIIKGPRAYLKALGINPALADRPADARKAMEVLCQAEQAFNDAVKGVEAQNQGGNPTAGVTVETES